MSTQKPPKDKRTKAYKEWKAKYESSAEGMGDVVEKITKATGIKAVVDKVADAFDADCGCDERKSKLNNLLRFRPKDCFTEEEFEYLSQFYSEKLNKFDPHITVSVEQQQKMIDIFNRVMPKRANMTTCGSCFNSAVYKPLSKVYSTYL